MSRVIIRGACDSRGVDVLHIVERVEEGIDELCGLDEESGQLVLHGGVDVVVLGGRDLKVLFELGSSVARMQKSSKVKINSMRSTKVQRTLNKFFSSLSVFSFLSRSLVRELLWRSKSTSLPRCKLRSTHGEEEGDAPCVPVW